MRQVFISYSSVEAAQAQEIVRLLEEQGIRCWIAPRDIQVGSNYTRDIPSAIKECPFFLLVLSKKSQGSKWVNKELTRAINQDKCILPLMIEDFAVSESFEFLLEDVQTRPYYRGKDATIREVLTLILGEVPEAEPQSAHEEPALTSDEMWRKGEELYNAGQYEAAVLYLQKAADQEHSGATNMLGFCYENGYGVKKDLGEALRLYRIAISLGNHLAIDRLHQLEASFSNTKTSHFAKSNEIILGPGEYVIGVDIPCRNYIFNPESGDGSVYCIYDDKVICLWKNISVADSMYGYAISKNVFYKGTRLKIDGSLTLLLTAL